MKRESRLWIRRPTSDQILRALERYAGACVAPTQVDLHLLVQEAAWVGLSTLRVPRFGLRNYLDTNDPGYGMDAVVEAFRGAPHCPKLQEIAREVLSQAGGNAEAASLHFRRIMGKYAYNRVKHILEEINKADHHITRGAKQAIPREMQRRDRMYFWAARVEAQEMRAPPQPSQDRAARTP